MVLKFHHLKENRIIWNAPSQKNVENVLSGKKLNPTYKIRTQNQGKET